MQGRTLASGFACQATLEQIKATADRYNLYNLEICIISQIKVLEHYFKKKKKKISLLLPYWLRIASRRAECSSACLTEAAIYFVEV